MSKDGEFFGMLAVKKGEALGFDMKTAKGMWGFWEREFSVPLKGEPGSRERYLAVWDSLTNFTPKEEINI